jgi:tRNA nucleotidyltransferase/poly(A) polymerase
VGFLDQVITWLAQQQVPAYLVGGCIRDRLLGRPVYDLDVTAAGDGLELARRLANRFGGAPLWTRTQHRPGDLKGDEGQRLVVDVARLRTDPRRLPGLRPGDRDHGQCLPPMSARQTR